jgi:signal transduction histidine kinase
VPLHAFDRFTGTDRARTTGSTGLSMAVVDTLTHRNQGTVTARNHPTAAPKSASSYPRHPRRRRGKSGFHFVENWCATWARTWAMSSQGESSSVRTGTVMVAFILAPSTGDRPQLTEHQLAQQRAF